MVLITHATEMKSLPLSLRNSTARNEKDRQLSNFHIDVDFVSVWQQITESSVAILSGRRLISGRYTVYSLTDGRIDPS